MGLKSAIFHQPSVVVRPPKTEPALRSDSLAEPSAQKMKLYNWGGIHTGNCRFQSYSWKQCARNLVARSNRKYFGRVQQRHAAMAGEHHHVVVVVVVFTLKTVLTSIQYPSLSYSSRQRNEFPWSHANPK